MDVEEKGETTEKEVLEEMEDSPGVAVQKVRLSASGILELAAAALTELQGTLGSREKKVRLGHMDKMDPMGIP